MAQTKERAVVESQVMLSDDVYSMWMSVDQMAADAKPGQFIMVYPKEGIRLLPRPISICEADPAHKRLRIVYRIAGEGTREFSAWEAGTAFEVMGPLGNGFPLKEKKALLIGGGIGIPPMLELAKQLSCEKEMVLGYRDVLFLEEELRTYCQVHIATEDGSSGTRGNVLDAIRGKNLQADVIYACGPTPMLRALKKYAIEQGIECWLSLEERMACGIGACLACVCKSVETDHHTHVCNKRVCKDGPVFLAQEVDL